MSDNKPKTCPVSHHNKKEGHGSTGGRCPMPNHGRKEPDDLPDKPLHPFVVSAHIANEQERNMPPVDPDDEIPESRIPSTGRGNSDDGKDWVNPSASQLYRALKRNNKPIDKKDADSVAGVHEMVTNATWELVMDYERMYASECKEPKLARFEGQYGNNTIKAKITKALFGLEPFDRHDWVVDRCGKEVPYIIDYYSIEDKVEMKDPHTGEKKVTSQVSYNIDARPAPTFSGLVSRTRMAWRRYWNNEDVW